MLRKRSCQADEKHGLDKQACSDHISDSETGRRACLSRQEC